MPFEGTATQFMGLIQLEKSGEHLQTSMCEPNLTYQEQQMLFPRG